MVSPRDFIGTQAVFTGDDGTTYIAQCSVPDDDKTPPLSGKVRAWLTVGGWRLRPIGDDLELTYIVKGEKFSPAIEVGTAAILPSYFNRPHLQLTLRAAYRAQWSTKSSYPFQNA